MLQFQFNQAVMVCFESECLRTAMHAGQGTRLIKQRLEQLGFYYYKGGFYLDLVRKQLKLML